jgi:ACS family tartrate transporter-like MFS transporter
LGAGATQVAPCDTFEFLTEVAPETTVAASARRRIFLRLLPFLFILYIINYLDRVNVAYAALTMSKDLGFSDEVFGTGAGIFFLGYVLLEIPGALIVERWSARKWMARIMISWGLLTVLVAFVNTAHQFYWARFLLGCAEAGFFPGIIVYLHHWFRREDRAKVISIFMAAIPLSNVIGSPFAGLLLGVHWHGIAGWRWLFALEGVPAVILGVVTLFYLTDWPSEARWLPEAELQWIENELAIEDSSRAHDELHNIWKPLRNFTVLLLALIGFFEYTGGYALLFWLPTILKRASNFSNFTVTLLAALPYLVGMVVMVLVGWNSDRTGERRWHAAVPMFVAAAAYGILIYAAGNLWLALAMFIVITACLNSFYAPFWALPSLTLGGSAAAASIGLINTIASFGGYFGPKVVGMLNTRTGSERAGLYYMLGCFLITGLLLMLFVKIDDHEHAAPG